MKEFDESLGKYARKVIKDEKSNELYTVGQMADKLDVLLNRVVYMINKHRIKHVMRVGITRLFDVDGLAKIKQHLEE